jgi:LIM domain/Protein DA1
MEFHLPKIVCTHCEKEILENYVSIEGKYYHPDHFICAECGLPISANYLKENNNNYHPHCHTKLFAEYCPICNKEIKNKFIHDEHNKYHPRCYKEHILEKCKICNKPLEGRYIIDNYGNEFHPYHQQEFHKCHNCGRLISPSITGGGEKLFSDGRHLCNICNHPPLTTTALNKIVTTVFGFLSSKGLFFDKDRISIKQVNMNGLRKLHKKGKFSENIKGYCYTETETISQNGKKISTKNHHTIYLLNRIPELDMASILCHELMHAWVYENTNKDHQARLLEGSCNYISYIFLKNINSPQAKLLIRQLTKNKNPIYGMGFKKVRKKFEPLELVKLLDYLKKRRNI